MTRISERIIAALLVLFLLAYVVYQAFRYYYNPLQVEAVFSYTVYHTIESIGAVIRDEVVIDSGVRGLQNFVSEDGERVAIGQTVVEFYDSDVSDRQVKRMRELKQEIEMLTEAQNPAISNYSNVEGLGRDIRGQLGQLARMASTGRYADAASVRSSVTSLLNKRQVATDKEHDYQQRIQTLQSEYNQLDSISGTASLDQVAAPVSGYFVKEVDGLEDRLYPEFIGELDVAGYRELVETAASAQSVPGKVGKIVTNENWYYIAMVPKYDIQWVKSGQTVQIKFDIIDDTVPGTVEEIHQENQDEYAALIIRCNYITGELLSLRAANARISFEQYSGLRINSANIRTPQDVPGVYVLSKNTVRFKTLDIIYEEPGFVISRPSNDPADTDTVKLFDQVITKGKDLYDGKVIE